MENCKRQNELICDKQCKENQGLEKDIKLNAAKVERKVEVAKDAIKEKSQEIGK